MGLHRFLLNLPTDAVSELAAGEPSDLTQLARTPYRPYSLATTCIMLSIAAFGADESTLIDVPGDWVVVTAVRLPPPALQDRQRRVHEV